jgi:hypothetical protein
MNISDIERLTQMLRDIRLEASTAMRHMEQEDPLRDSLLYISDVSTSAISHIEQK